MFKLVVLSVTLALTSATGLAPLGLGWGAPWGASWGAPLGHLAAAPLAAAVAAPAVVAPAAIAAPLGLGHRAYNYRGPLSLAPGQPANILAADGRPLDTLSVNLDRAAHYTARAVDGGHLLKKRSIVAPALAWSHAARVDWPGARLIAPAVAPLAVAAPIAPIAPWGLGTAGRWGHGW